MAIIRQTSTRTVSSIIVATLLAAIVLVGIQSSARLAAPEPHRQSELDAARLALSLRKDGIRVATVVGAPEPFSTRIKAHLEQALNRSGIKTLSTPNSRRSNVMRIFIVPEQIGSRVKFSFVSHVTDRGGKLVARMADEILVMPAHPIRVVDAWSSSAPEISSRIGELTHNDPRSPLLIVDLWGATSVDSMAIVGQMIMTELFYYPMWQP